MRTFDWRAGWNRWRRWWREPHFLEKCAFFGGLLTLLQLVLFPPDSPLQMLCVLGGLAAMLMLPVAPKTACSAGLALCLASTFLPQRYWNINGIAVIVMFLAAGYAMPRLVAALLPLAYAVVDALFYVRFGTGASGGTIVESLLDTFADADPRSSLPSHAVDTMPQHELIVFVGALVFEMMVFGFLAILGVSFRRTTQDTRRLARTERMLGRVTREQRLAHMIHDAVANDMSTIAMLAWRAKTADDDAAMLDSIYKRSQHALERVHEVIDVLNGKRELDAELSAAKTGGSGAPDEAGPRSGPAGGADAVTMPGTDGRPGAGSAAAGAGPDALDGPDGSEYSFGSDATGPGTPSAAGTPASPASFDARLEKYVEDQDRAMAMLGLHGATRLTSAPDADVPVPVQRAAMNLTEEIYANIVRHCALDAEGPRQADTDARVDDMQEPAYNLFIDIAKDRVRISEVNALTESSKTMVHGTRHGNGVAMQATAIEALVGTLHATAQDGAWTLSAEIPWNGPAANTI